MAALSFGRVALLMVYRLRVRFFRQDHDREGNATFAANGGIFK
jgi:hypothetical protein